MDIYHLLFVLSYDRACMNYEGGYDDALFLEKLIHRIISNADHFSDIVFSSEEEKYISSAIKWVKRRYIDYIKL